MKALSQDRNWLKLIGIIGVLSATMLLSRCSEGFVYRSQMNAPLLLRSVCLEQIYHYERTGRFLKNLAEQGKFPNPYPEFYTHSTRYAADRVFHYATSKSVHLKSYVGLVVALPQGTQATTTKASSAIAILCEATKPGATPATDPTFNTSTLGCGPQTQQVNALLTLQ